jgi:hypothetical protein
MVEILGAKMFFDPADFLKLVSRLALDIFFVYILVRLIYYPIYKRRDYLFTYFMFNVITFLLCIILRKVPIELGFALELFAVFGILRYRTEPIGIRDLTYLFISIGLALINALANKKISVAELLLANMVIVGMPYMLERAFMGGDDGEKRVRYDRLDLLQPGREQDLLEDLKERTGLEVLRVQILRMDLLRDTADLTVFHRTHSENEHGLVKKS